MSSARPDCRWERIEDGAAAARRRMRADVRAGLLGPSQKELPPTYFYDAAGSALFDEITRLDEYYLTRAERRLLEIHGAEIIRRTRPRALAELGAGMSTKTRILLRAFENGGGGTYVPIDVDANTLHSSAAALREEFPSLDVRPLVADMRDQVAVPWTTERPLLYAFLGSTIGNFDTRDARTLLARVRAGLCAGDSLLLGVDLIKDTATLEAAYNDSRGVTPEFNRNILRVLNAQLGSTFDVEDFEHLAFYNSEQQRIEMHLVARHAQHVLVPGVGVVRIRAGETIRTEISSKYDRQSVEELLAGAAWRIDSWLTDDAELFALVIARPAPLTAGAVPSVAGHRAAREITDHLRQFVARRLFAPSMRSPVQRIGAEIEFVALDASDGSVAQLEAGGDRSVLGAVRSAARRHCWVEGRSTKGAPWFRVGRGGRVTFEPGGQIEYASPPFTSVTAVLDDLGATASILRDECADRGILLLDCGLDPVNDASRAPLQVNARRYRRMDAHFARIGPAGARMMRQTASLQVALDIGADARARWRLLNALAPMLTAIFANSRRYACEDTGFASYRAETWRRTDPARTGLLTGIDPIGEYVDFALRAPAILLGAEDEPARPFEQWIGAGGVAHWEKHLGTLFPDVRPRGYFEVRSIDAVPEAQWPAALAFLTGLAYDPVAAAEAAEIVGDPDTGLLERAGRMGLRDAALARMAGELATVALNGCRRLGSSVVAERHVGAAVGFFTTLTG